MILFNQLFKALFCLFQLFGVAEPAAGPVHVKQQTAQSQRGVAVGNLQQDIGYFFGVLRKSAGGV